MGYWDQRELIADEAEEAEEASETTLDDLESEVMEELSEVEKSFRQRMTAENKRFRDMCDTEYWFCVCFTSRAQKEEMLEKLGLPLEEKYIAGREFAKAVHAQLKTEDIKFARIKKPNKDYSDRSMKINK